MKISKERLNREKISTLKTDILILGRAIGMAEGRVQAAEKELRELEWNRYRLQLELEQLESKLARK